MHWVDRGPEPARLAEIRLRRTQRWVSHYTDGVGQKPTDADWRRFHEELRVVFSGLCAYCEEIDKGEIDHFKPKSDFPHLVYEWTNWVFACHNCNQSKLDKWLPGGYVYPCAEDLSEHPENFFAFNTLTGKLKPKADIYENKRQKAQKTIDDLCLNAWYHVKKRMEWLDFLSRHLDLLIGDYQAEDEFISKVSDRGYELSSIARSLLTERDFIIDD